jgi:hypothetical protein
LFDEECAEVNEEKRKEEDKNAYKPGQKRGVCSEKRQGSSTKRL